MFCNCRGIEMLYVRKIKVFDDELVNTRKKLLPQTAILQLWLSNSDEVLQVC